MVHSWVSLHPEGVDWNDIIDIVITANDVSLHPEGVDWNDVESAEMEWFEVSLHPEGVDWNVPDCGLLNRQ